MPAASPPSPSLPPKVLPLHEHPDTLARAAGFRLIAGVDEAGRGPWAGPVVSAAVILHRPRLPHGIRIDDSKRLTARQRAATFDVILEHADVGLGIVCAEEIDRINILQATLRSMARAVQDLPSAPELVLVDGASVPPLAIPCWAVIDGDARSYLIACASIVAKVARDRFMGFYHRLYPQYAFERHKGYGTTLHMQRLAQWGPSFLHRASFAPVANCRSRKVFVEPSSADVAVSLDIH